jgi:hypothetical protein
MGVTRVKPQHGFIDNYQKEAGLARQNLRDSSH